MFQFGGLEFCLWGLSPSKPLCRLGCRPTLRDDGDKIASTKNVECAEWQEEESCKAGCTRKGYFHDSSLCELCLMTSPRLGK